jgi:hypothetical protein
VRRREGQRQQTAGGVPTEVAAAIGKKIADQVLSASTESAKNLLSTYGKIDILRPYFDVEPRDVSRRCDKRVRVSGRWRANRAASLSR